MAVIVRELIIKAVVDNRNDEMIPPVIKYEIVQEAVEQVMKIFTRTKMISGKSLWH